MNVNYHRLKKLSRQTQLPPIKSWLASVMFMALLFLCGVATQASQHDAELLNLTNTERQKAGLPALKLSSQLGQAAQGHAQDMAQNNYFSHTGLNGSSPFDRIKATGYNYSTAGEKIAGGQTTPPPVI